MYADGLWISDISVHLHRENAPIPENMRNQYIKIKLTDTQMKAFAAILGLGMRNGDVLCYTDDVLYDMCMSDSDTTMHENFKRLAADQNSMRRSAGQIFVPIVEEHFIPQRDEDGKYHFVEPDGSPTIKHLTDDAVNSIQAIPKTVPETAKNKKTATESETVNIL